ncbi:hypothetical protein P0F37_003349 [Vibrio metschnikovii]|nr:hypothetical protein [Vibrio metschnikovii]EKO3750643.1 hypothetical protein [Vibrio metschnikovii]EKO3790457.1 hypothetical protein [Vibrio metschnikovii]EKO3878140.1 hypothetical protein [Vibrio metschnikovii]EKO3940890.1 hypothetical protein [Vibrio metschnikovii]
MKGLTQAAKPVSISEKSRLAKVGFFTSGERLIPKAFDLNPDLVSDMNMYKKAPCKKGAFLYIKPV